MRLDLNQYGRARFIIEFNEAESFYVTEYNDITAAINDTHKLIKHRGPSANRLKLLLNMFTDNITMPHTEHKLTGVKCFKVCSKICVEDFDIVAVLSDGSFASSCPRTANFGMPCSDVLAVIINGYAELNFVWHFHPMWHNDFISNIITNNDMSSKSVDNVT